MKPIDVKSHIQKKEFLPVYIFTGEEVGIQGIYIDMIGKVSEKEVCRLDTFQDVFQQLRKSSILSTSKVYVVRDDTAIMDDVKAQQILFDKKFIGDNIVILVYSSMDKRKKFYKENQDLICEFEPLDEKMLTKYIKKEINLSEKNCQALIQICENSYTRIMLEADKIKQYVNRLGPAETQDAVFVKFLKNGVIYQPPTDAIFDFVDAVMQRKVKAFDLMQESFESGEASMVMISVLYNNIKQTLQVKACNSKDVSKSTGLTGWQIKCVKPYIDRWEIWELLDAMKLLRSVETGIKTGKIEDKMAVPYVLVNIF